MDFRALIHNQSSTDFVLHSNNFTTIIEHNDPSTPYKRHYATNLRIDGNNCRFFRGVPFGTMKAHTVP